MPRLSHVNAIFQYQIALGNFFPLSVAASVFLRISALSIIITEAPNISSNTHNALGVLTIHEGRKRQHTVRFRLMTASFNFNTLGYITLTYMYYLEIKVPVRNPLSCSFLLSPQPYNHAEAPCLLHLAQLSNLGVSPLCSLAKLVLPSVPSSMCFLPARVI